MKACNTSSEICNKWRLINEYFNIYIPKYINNDYNKITGDVFIEIKIKEVNCKWGFFKRQNYKVYVENIFAGYFNVLNNKINLTAFLAKNNILMHDKWYSVLVSSDKTMLYEVNFLFELERQGSFYNA